MLRLNDFVSFERLISKTDWKPNSQKIHRNLMKDNINYECAPQSVKRRENKKKKKYHKVVVDNPGWQAGHVQTAHLGNYLANTIWCV